MVKNPGKENMKIITKEGQEIKKYTPSEDQRPPVKRKESGELPISLKMERLSMCGIREYSTY